VPERNEEALSADEEPEVEIHWMRRGGESDVEAHALDRPGDAETPDVEGHAFKV
jgi:hypothetical protein